MMDEIIRWVMEKIIPDNIGGYIYAAVTIGSAIAAACPTLSKKSKLLPIIKFISKYIAWNKYGPEKRPE